MNTRRWAALALCGALVVGVAACGNDDDGTSTIKAAPLTATERNAAAAASKRADSERWAGAAENDAAKATAADIARVHAVTSAAADRTERASHLAANARTYGLTAEQFGAPASDDVPGDPFGGNRR